MDDVEILIGEFPASNGGEITVRLLIGGDDVLIDFRETFQKGGQTFYTKKGIRVNVDSLNEISEVIENVKNAIPTKETV